MVHRVAVSDHAVLRYLERVGGFEIEALRRDMADRISRTAVPGANSVVIDGHRFLIKDHEGTPCVVTVLEREWRVSLDSEEGHQ